jgi:iron complex outermembrane receptor protein
VTLQPLSVTDSMTVTPARTEQRLGDLPASITILDSRDASQAAAQTVDDLLRQVPGFSIFRRSSSLVANPTTQGVSLRGAGASGSSRTLVLSDGLPLNDPFGGWVYWDRIPRAAIDHIEVVRGGSSDLYGSDALSGVINVIGRSPSQTTFTLETSYGNHNTADVSFFGGFKVGAWGISVGGEALNTDGYFIVAPEQRGRVDQEAASAHQALNLRIERHWSASSYFFVRGTLFNEDRKNGTPLQRNDTVSEGLALGGSTTTRDGSTWNLSVFAGDQRFHQTFTSISADRNSESLIRLQAVPVRDAGLYFGWQRPSWGRHTLVAGFDIRGVRGESDETVVSNNIATSQVDAGGRQMRLGLYGEDLITLTQRWQLTLSGRYDRWRDSGGSSVTRSLSTGVVVPRFFNERIEEAFNPRIALLFHASENLTFRAAGYRAFRAPTLNELYRSFRVGNTNTLANETLGPERLTGGEAGATWTPGTRFTTRLTGYWTQTVNPITNFTISVTPALITRQRRNLGRTRSLGFEAETDLRLTSRWNFSAGYLYSNAEVVRAPQDPTLEGLWVPQVPRQQFTLQLSYTHPSIVTAAMQLRSSGMQFDDDQNLFPLERFTVVDVTVSHRFNRMFEGFVAAQNLFNARYAVGRTPLETIGAPILVRAGIWFRFER